MSEAEAERIAILDLVKRRRSEMSSAQMNWTWRQNFLWRWLLPYHAGEMAGALRALGDIQRDIEVNAQRWERDFMLKYTQDNHS